MQTIDPRGMTVQSWTALSTFYISPYGSPPKLTDADQWRDWANFVVSLPAIAALNPPRPTGFSDWDAWANQFNRVAQLLVT